MRAHLRAGAPSTAAAAAALAVMSWLGLYGFAWNDYDFEAAPAYLALVHGHLARFLQLLPAYGGSLELRAPFALLPALFGGGELAVYRLVALPCLLSGAALGLWLVARMRADGHSRLSRAVALGICVANPITLLALQIGHPEELLGGVLCVAAVVVAARERPVWAGLLLGLAIANKEWAVLAIGPALLALPGERAITKPRLRLILVAAAVFAAFFLPMLIVHPGASNPAAGAIGHSGGIFNPEQAFWFAGTGGHVVLDPVGRPLPGARIAPGWLDHTAHPLIVALAIPLTLLYLRRRRADRRLADALLLMALLMLLRCVLDPWDAAYYPLPFVLALLGWETTTRRAPPVLSLAASAAVWFIFHWLANHARGDVIAAGSMAIALPAVAALALALYRRPATTQARHVAGPAAISRRSPVPS